MDKLIPDVSGVLLKVQTCFENLQKQEKRALSTLKQRMAEIENRLFEESKEKEDGEYIGRSLKEIEIVDKLNNDTLKILSDNNKNYIELIKVYSNLIKKEEGEESKETDGTSSSLSHVDLEYLRGMKNNFKFKTDK